MEHCSLVQEHYNLALGHCSSVPEHYKLAGLLVPGHCNLVLQGHYSLVLEHYMLVEMLQVHCNLVQGQVHCNLV